MTSCRVPKWLKPPDVRKLRVRRMTFASERASMQPVAK
jgi:hypothetical protein